MNLTMTTQWSKNDRRTYLIVTVSANDNTEAKASQTYLDIQMPEGVRMRSIGSLPSDGHGNSIGVDLPDLAAGDQQHLVFGVRNRGSDVNPVAPELHLHWIDSTSGDLMERHQTGTEMPTEPVEVDTDLAEIVDNARSQRTPMQRRTRCTERNKEQDSMKTERQIERHYRRGGRHDHRRNRTDQDREYGRCGGRAGRHARSAWTGTEGAYPHDRRGGKGHLYRTIARMQEQIDELEWRMQRAQREAKMAAMSPHERTEMREIVRTRREPGSGRIPSRSHRGHRWHGEGRRMGRAMNRAFAASRHALDDLHPEA